MGKKKITRGAYDAETAELVVTITKSESGAKVTEEQHRKDMWDHFRIVREYVESSDHFEVEQIEAAKKAAHPIDWWPQPPGDWFIDNGGSDVDAYGSWCYVEGYAAALNLTTSEVWDFLELSKVQGG